MQNPTQSFQVVRKAMSNPDEWVIEFMYRDASGKETHRIVSPVRFLSNGRFLALCLGREECRQFYLDRCQQVVLKPANECVMPIVM